MNLKRTALLATIGLAAGGGAWWWIWQKNTFSPGTGFAGSAECRSCHEQFYQKWSTSFHGLAMRPFSRELAVAQLVPQTGAIMIRGRTYRVEIDGEGGLVRESGPDGGKTYRIEHALGGKNVFYFLTDRPGGRLQVLPVAFDVGRKEWYDTTATMLRHIPELRDEPLDWTDRALTFNTSCYNCHVSQLAKNYSVETDSYRTVWKEPGINCESCHGPGAAHIVAARAAKGQPLRDPGLIVPRLFSSGRINSMCAPCHAKMSPLDDAFQAGDRFFDHFNLMTLEDRDFYPDGRDYGENFTYTSWLMSPCAASGRLDCMHCHTSSGRYKFAESDADKACLPCHASLVADPGAHSHHPAGSKASRCVSCHMPETAFARMRRHDHSMRSPAPAATIRFGSPNACSLCHGDRDAGWADRWVRKWYSRDYQAALIHEAELIDAARKEDWTRLPEMKAYLVNQNRNEVFAASLLRLLGSCRLPEKWPLYLEALKDRSPLVRSSAAAGLASCTLTQATTGLSEATADSFRVVRVQAAASLAGHDRESLNPDIRQAVEKASTEYEAALKSQPDDPRSHYNLGNYYMECGESSKALAEYETSLKLSPSFIPALVNSSIVYARLGKTNAAERCLRDALKYNPGSAEASFNLALLLAEQGRVEEAENLLRRSLQSNPSFAEAAYNLAVLLAGSRLDEALGLCRKASALAPEEFKYAYTLAFYLRQGGDAANAVRLLESLIRQHPEEADGFALLGSIYEETGRRNRAVALYRRASENEALPESARRRFADAFSRLSLR
jgi:tetratricopeptide (TPR) repeat protein